MDNVHPIFQPMLKAIKTNPKGRVCAICGKWGGSGFTHALRFAGYDVPIGTMGYAHNACLQKVRRVK